jgi:hypothetical protein
VRASVLDCAGAGLGALAGTLDGSGTWAGLTTGVLDAAAGSLGADAEE